ncbi:gephyrin-like molybdotransferase Glp [Sporomusa aerivorans]|uniref:molybdopterin molybdotransferase MoeA n=1 Tax=Sporomusa aerivorans TaxID=204936 RepID=UPI00352A6283
MKTSISLEEAHAILGELVQPVKPGYVSLFAAAGRVLCRDIQSGVNLPAFSKSPLDGYAVQAGDTQTASRSQPVVLEVIEEVRAGYVPQRKVVSGTAIKVMTGAPVPEGADEIIKYEDVVRENNHISLSYPLQPGKNVIKAGEDVTLGEMIACRGALLNPPLVGLLAAVGIAQVPVYEKVKVAILSTGDELVDPATALLPGKIYNSNLHSLNAFCSQLGTEPISMGIVPDEKEAIVARLGQALSAADLVITTGGVSVGDYDVVPDALEAIGAEIAFWKVDMKPGSPVIAARYNQKLIIGLSGNPAAAFITFDLIVVPLIKKMMGLAEQFPPKISAILTDSFNKPSQQRRFLRARVQRDNEMNYVKLTGEQSNGVLKSMIDCNALIDVPAGSGPLIAGQEVSAVVLRNAAAGIFI